MAKLIQGVNDLATTYPTIAAQWHPAKNGNLTPVKVTHGSAEKVWWIGDCGHEWEARINKRTTCKQGCPYCSGHRLMPGFNDLATTNPELTAEWHPIKNGQVTPDKVMVGARKKVWWKGGCGHEWEAAVKERSRAKPRGCPYCSGKKVLTGFNDLATTYPTIAAQWHPTRNGELTAEQVTPHSNKQIWWQCARGHEWEAKINDRTAGKNCPICSEEYKTSFPEKAIFYYLSFLFPDALSGKRYKWLNNKELDIYIPSLKIGIEYDGQLWHQDIKRDTIKNTLCKQHGIRLIRIREPGCPVISEENIELKSHGANDLNKAIQQLCSVVGKTIDIDVERDRFKIYGLIEHGDKENSFSEKNPDIAAQWHPTKNGNLTPEQVTYGSGKKVWWLGDCGHEWEAKIDNRIRWSGCPYCSNKKVLIGFNDLETQNPALAEEWHPSKNNGLKPSDVTPGSHKKIWWKCSNGHEWEAEIKSRNKGAGCPFCTGRRKM